jgi:hypothetical protein
MILFKNILENLRKERAEVHRQNEQGRSSLSVTKAIEYIRMTGTTNEEINVFNMATNKFLPIV